ncbi:MAG: HDOD domain-containing protein [Phycisphaerae bacterium]|nr:HDOD domain-containing protein [Phycisphaerae bacterium]
MMRIVFVDDDPQVLEGLRRMLFGRRDVWQMRFFTDPQAALAGLEQEAAELVISDLQMPGMDGVAFLEQVRQRSCETIRYVLTGVLDHPLLGHAMRCAHQVIAKPCRPNILCEVIERAAAIKARLSEIKKTTLFSDLNDLPVMPDTHRKVLDVLASPNASPRRLGQLVAEDMGMSARIVRLANTPWFGRSGHFHDPVQAVLFLGVKTVEAVVLTEGIFSHLSPELVQTFGIGGLQAHCLRVGLLARTICLDLEFSAEQTEASSTAGILHDAGKIVLLLKAQEMFGQAIQQSRIEGLPLYEVERQLLGISHAELVGAMLQLWAMPAEIIEATACHHRPSEAASRLGSSSSATLADIICLADVIDHCLCSSGVDGVTPAFDYQRLGQLGLDEVVAEWTRRHIDIYNKDIFHECQYA